MNWYNFQILLQKLLREQEEVEEIKPIRTGFNILFKDGTKFYLNVEESWE